MEKHPEMLALTHRRAAACATQNDAIITGITRRKLLAAGGCTLAVAPFLRIRPAGAAEFTYKYANNLPTTHPLNQRAAEAADKIRTETGGRVQIDIFPHGELGSDTSMLSQLRAGAIDFLTLSGPILSILVPDASINGIAFAFADYDAVWRAMDGQLGAFVRAQIEKADLIAMEKIWDNGFRQITASTKPINTPADLRDFKIRVPVSPLWISLFRAFNSAPISLNFSELYFALKNRLVDAQENPLAIISAAKLYEVQKYCSLTNHMWDGFWFLANRRAWEKLPEDLRAIVARNIDAAALLERADVAKLNAGLQAELTSKGMVINETKADAFRDALRKAGVYAEWKKKYGDEAWAILEKAVGSSLS